MRLGRYKPLVSRGIQIVVALFGAFGGFLNRVAPPDEANARLAIGVSQFAALGILLLVSAMSSGRRSASSRRRWMIAGVVSLLTMIVSGGIYTWYLDKLTFPYPPPPSAIETYRIAGTILTEQAETYRSEFRRSYGRNPTSGELALNLPHDQIWTRQSVARSTMMLSGSYLMLVLSLSTAVFCLVEANRRS
jgi:hypothetical protein